MPGVMTVSNLLADVRRNDGIEAGIRMAEQIIGAAAAILAYEAGSDRAEEALISASAAAMDEVSEAG
jgi:hypothetical protein